jgi:internalin A
MVVTSEWSSDDAECVDKGGVDRIVLNYARGFRGDNLAFLSRLPIRRLLIIARWLGDLTPLSSLGSSLEDLNVEAAPGAVIDVSRLPGLLRLAASWKSIRDTVGALSGVRDIFLLEYAGTDLMPLSHLQQLRCIRMKQHTRIRSLDGLDAFSRLERLDVFHGTRLIDIAALSVAPLGLTHLALGTCRKIADVDPLSACSALTYLELSEDGGIRSVLPLAGLSQLEKFIAHGDTRICDGDLSPLGVLPNLRVLAMASRRFYRPSVREIQEHIAGRTRSDTQDEAVW